MEELFDLHSHIIPNIKGDDGSENIGISKQMLERAFTSGTRKIVATPHVIEISSCASWQEIKTQVLAVQKIAPDGLAVYPGAELMMNWELLPLYKEKGAYSLNGSRYALVELPMLEIPRYAEDFFFEMQVMGKVPILAHPERYRGLFEQPDRLLSWLKKGVLLQINAGSLTGKFGDKAKQNAEFLLKNHVVAFIGSDAHGIGGRNTDLSEMVKRLKEFAGEKALAIINDNSKKVLENDVLELEVPTKFVIDEKKNFWSRIFG